MKPLNQYIHMSKHTTTSKEMVATKNKHKVLSCSTPEHQAESPSRDSDAICDSDAGSPVPFLCTQDGAEGLTDVVWNFYTPKSEQKARQKATPVSKRSKRSLRPKFVEKKLPKRRPQKPTQKKNELFQELVELNENLHELIAKKTNDNCTDKSQSVSEDDIFSDMLDCSPKSTVRSKHCLRKNVLSSNFTKPDVDMALDSDDSINECLIKASQVVEEKILNDPVSVKRLNFNSNVKNEIMKTNCNFKIDHDSMDAILNNIKIESPLINNAKKYDSMHLHNDSFDSLVGNLNDSALDQMTQMPNNSEKSLNKKTLNTSKDNPNLTIMELVLQDSPPFSKSFFGRYNSMPVSPSVSKNNKPSTSGMVFGRYNSMPFENNNEELMGVNDSPIRCTPDEIKKKHLLAREKLLAKRLLPFTVSQKTVQSQIGQQPPKRTEETVLLGSKKFNPKVASHTLHSQNKAVTNNLENKSNNSDIKLIIEKKRQQALMKLRRRQVPGKMI